MEGKKVSVRQAKKRGKLGHCATKDQKEGAKVKRGRREKKLGKRTGVGGRNMGKRGNQRGTEDSYKKEGRANIWGGTHLQKQKISGGEKNSGKQTDMRPYT